MNSTEGHIGITREPLPLEMHVNVGIGNGHTLARDNILRTIERYVDIIDSATTELQSSTEIALQALSDVDITACRTFLLQAARFLSQIKSSANDLFQIHAKLSLTQKDSSLNELTPKIVTVKGGECVRNSNADELQGKGAICDVITIKTEAKSGDSDTDHYESGGDFETPPGLQPTKEVKEKKSRKSKPRKSKIQYDATIDEDGDYTPETKKSKVATRRKLKAKVNEPVNEAVKSRAPKRTWPCSGCDSVFRTRTLLRDHEINDHGIEPRKRKPKEAIKAQPREETPQEKYKCEYCDEIIEGSRLYFRHRKFSHPDHFFKYGGLKEEAERMGLENGINDIIKEQALASIVEESQSQNTMNTSEQTDNVAASVGVSIGYDKKEAIENKYVCDVCGKICKSQPLLRMHMKIHTLAHQCKTCGKRLATSSQLKYHERIHTGEEPYECKECKATFRYSTLLHTHMYTYHSTVKPYRCEQCDVGFRFKRSLTLHYQSKHSEIRPYQCTQCNKGFVEKVYYDLHMAQHSGVRDLKCEKCDATFCTKPGLNKHIRITHSDKTVVCHICAKSFNHHSKLHSHMKAHSGERPFVCSVCNKSFTWGHLLKQHMRTHTGEKPYKCEHCGRTFLCSGNLTKHRRTHLKHQQQQQQQQQQNAQQNNIHEQPSRDAMNSFTHAQVNQMFGMATHMGFE